MDKKKVAILVYGKQGSGRDALAEEKYSALAKAFLENGFDIRSVLYNDQDAELAAKELSEFDAILVWVNPIEKGNSRKKLDSMLDELSGKGIFVSTQPGIILKIGTKEILYETRDLDWGGDTMIYRNFEEFKDQFPSSLSVTGIRVLKQFRGNGGNGVFKIIADPGGEKIIVIHAAGADQPKTYQPEEFYQEFKIYFSDGGSLIDQPWNENIQNGMVRCYLTGSKVSGFGFQEINALYPSPSSSLELIPTSKRFYFTENCFLFRELKKLMEEKWVPELLEKMDISVKELPVIWDADFFINDDSSQSAKSKYNLCEINVSCVSPFPPSSILFMVKMLKQRLF